MATDQYGARLPEGAVARLGTPRPSREGERVSALAFSPDGSTIASGGEDGSVRLWDLTSWREIRRFGEHLRQVGAVAFCHHGRTLVSGAHDGSIAFWDVDNGKELSNFQAPTGTVAFFSLDDSTMLTVGADEKYRAYDLNTLAEVAADATHLGKINDIAFSNDGHQVAIGTWESLVRICDFANGQELRQFVGHRAAVESVAFSPDMRNLASAGMDETVRIWELLTGKERFQIPNRKENTFALAFSPDNRTLATANNDSTILVWDLTFKPPVKGPNARPPGSLLPSQLEPLWLELVNPDPFVAFRAVWTVAYHAKQMIPFIKGRLKMLVPVDQQRVVVLLSELNHDQVKRRDKACDDLEKLGALCEPMLRTALKNKPSMDARRRLERLLEKAVAPVPSNDTLHILRLIESMELANTVESRQVLEWLTRGDLPPRIVRDAQASLGRLHERAPLPA
jgi:WD40 repeat protein